jgi:hypothetical protein
VTWKYSVKKSLIINLVLEQTLGARSIRSKPKGDEARHYLKRTLQSRLIIDGGASRCQWVLGNVKLCSNIGATALESYASEDTRGKSKVYSNWDLVETVLGNAENSIHSRVLDILSSVVPNKL